MTDNAFGVFNGPDCGEWSGSAVRDDLPSDSVTVTVDTARQYAVMLSFFVQSHWNISDGATMTKLSRTDDAVLFADPTPAVGTGAGFSPFDDCYPWNGMTKVMDGENVLVKIHKYWVKVQHSPFRVQIADKPTPGYQVSPAHRDRGDGYGERDAVYIGRYECDGSSVKDSGIRGARQKGAKIRPRKTGNFRGKPKETGNG